MTTLSGDETLFSFPCDFPLKVMGKNLPGFASTVVKLVHRHAPDFDAATLQSRLSKGDRYLSLTLMIHATSRTQLDAIYHDLTACEDVAMVL